MSGREALRCTKNFPHTASDRATELLLIQDPYDGNVWDVKLRCTEHPAADDIPILRRINPSLICVIVPLDGAK